MRGFLGFYGRLLFRTPDALRGSHEAAMYWIGTVGMAVVLYFNEDVGKRLIAGWDGIPREWAAMPVVTGAILRMAINNYEGFERLRVSIATQSGLIAFTEQLGAFLETGKTLQEHCENGTLKRAQCSAWEKEVVAYLQTHPRYHGVAMASRFRAAKEVEVAAPQPATAWGMRAIDFPGKHQVLWRRLERRTRLLPKFISEAMSLKIDIKP